MSILEEFYYSVMEPQPCSAAYHAEIREVAGLYKRHKEKLLAGFTDEQKDCFQKFEDCISEWRAIDRRCSFLTGFRTGVRMTAESFTAET
ncbi:MAG: hypothetical protein IJV76_09815 [Clostridia bacterium]|nr:hypothetical protein [Clostridia bacterium]